MIFIDVENYYCWVESGVYLGRNKIVECFDDTVKMETHYRRSRNKSKMKPNTVKHTLN